MDLGGTPKIEYTKVSYGFWRIGFRSSERIKYSIFLLCESESSFVNIIGRLDFKVTRYPLFSIYGWDPNRLAILRNKT